MARLSDLAIMLRSKNAGPLFVTFDIMFSTREQLAAVLSANVLTPALIGRLYDVHEDDVKIIPYEIVNAIKITIPRNIISGDLQDCDIYGCQQHMPLADVLLPD
jgi:hypothetical protein